MNRTATLFVLFILFTLYFSISYAEDPQTDSDDDFSSALTNIASSSTSNVGSPTPDGVSLNGDIRQPATVDTTSSEPQTDHSDLTQKNTSSDNTDEKHPSELNSSVNNRDDTSQSNKANSSETSLPNDDNETYYDIVTPTFQGIISNSGNDSENTHQQDSQTDYDQNTNTVDHPPIHISPPNDQKSTLEEMKLVSRKYSESEDEFYDAEAFIPYYQAVISSWDGKIRYSYKSLIKYCEPLIKYYESFIKYSKSYFGNFDPFLKIFQLLSLLDISG